MQMMAQAIADERGFVDDWESAPPWFQVCEFWKLQVDSD